MGANQPSYFAEVKEIASLLQLRPIQTADGSKPTRHTKVRATVDGVQRAVTKLRTLEGEVERLKAELADRPKRPHYVAFDELAESTRNAVRGLRLLDFPPELNLSKMQVFRGENGVEYVALGHNPQRKVYGTVSIRKSTLFDPNLNAPFLVLSTSNYRDEFVAEQVGDISQLKAARLQRFWRVMGGEPRVLEVSTSAHGWVRASVVDYQPGRRPIKLEYVALPSGATHRRISLAHNFSLLREPTREPAEGALVGVPPVVGVVVD
jgi:hypothetical protein